MKKCFLLAAGLLFYAGCSGGGGQPASPRLNLPPTAIRAHRPASQAAMAGTYFALGDSIVIGLGLAPSESYPSLIGTAENYNAQNLGVSGATTQNVVTSQFPLVVGPCALGTTGIGGNDASQILVGNETLSTFTNNIQGIVHTVSQRCARSVVTTIINNSFSTENQRYPGWSNEVNTLNSEILKFYYGVVVVDLNTDSRLHNRSYFQSDLIHPNAAGQAAIANDIEARLSHEAVDWTHYGYDESRTSYNPYETVLSQATVPNLKLKWQHYEDKTYYAQPLYVHNVSINGGSKDVLYIVGANYVYAVDPYALDNSQTFSYLWARALSGSGENQQTPVIDVANNTMYFGKRQVKAVLTT